MPTALVDSLQSTVDRLARLESERFPVVSLYLDARPDGNGRDHYKPFVRKELAARQRTYPLRSPERESFDRDMEKIQRFLGDGVKPSTNGIAIFACAGEGELFEALQLEVPFEDNRLSVADRPQLFPLARVIDENPRYALVLADTRSARIDVFAQGFWIDEREIESRTLPRTHGSGVSDTRYQRHVDELQKHHARELVEQLDRVVAQDRVEHIVLAGNDVILPLIRHELPKRLEQKLVDTLHFDSKRPVTEILAAANELLREHDAKTDVETAGRLLDVYRSGGLAVAGPEDVGRALQWSQVDELVIAATLEREGPEREKEAAELVALARRTEAKVTFIEDPKLLEPIEGVGAFLRYSLAARGAAGPLATHTP
jgi:peptide subunit release factor 1 (eRF1)